MERLSTITKYFTTEWGEKVDIVTHTIEQMGRWANLKIYIGTDSQDFTSYGATRYATAIVYRYGHKGAHYIYFLEDVPIIRDMYTRLFGEAERTLDAAQLIGSEIPVAFEALEFDYNHIKKFKSSQLVQTVRGWVQGFGYNAVFKSGQMIAAKAADHIVRKKKPDYGNDNNERNPDSPNEHKEITARIL